MKGTSEGVSLKYDWYSCRWPHFLRPAFSNSGIPDTLVINRKTKKGDKTEIYWKRLKTEEAEI